MTSPDTDHRSGRGARPVAVRRRRLWRIAALSVALAGLVALTLRGKLPSAPEVADAISGASVAWLLVAAAMQAVSMAGFALQQRALLGALGVRIRFGRAMAITLARSAISISLPAGAAVSAAYALRHYRRAGASSDISTATMIVSGLVSIGGLAALYVAGVLGTVIRDPTSLWDEPPAALAVTSIVLLLMLAGLTAALIASIRRRRRGAIVASVSARPAAGGRLAQYAAAVWSTTRNAWRAGGTLRVRDWIVALAYAAANWLTDLLCLAACTRALGLPIGITTLASIYLVVQIVRQVPITPGGVGLIETAFIAGLTAAGTSAASATAAVLIYRVLSCWIVIPIGGFAAVVLNRVASAETPDAQGSSMDGSDAPAVEADEREPDLDHRPVPSSTPRQPNLSESTAVLEADRATDAAPLLAPLPSSSDQDGLRR
jgi:putative heme transporter